MAALPSPPLSIESEKIEQKVRMWQRFSISRWLGREDRTAGCPNEAKEPPAVPRPGVLSRRLSRKVVPGLPRPPTFRRQNSERRERLKPIEPSTTERRTLSVDRRRASSACPPPLLPVPSRKKSAPEANEIGSDNEPASVNPVPNATPITPEQSQFPPPPPPPPIPPAPQNRREDEPPKSEASFDGKIDDEIKDELEKKWILNLSMHFRDQSPREKFFLTYAETPQKWRRVTVSCDYRDAPADSLERDLQNLQFQRDKSARIYESIRSSLPDIQFYDTVTNLKLETRDDRLHVHVTEDINEIIPYPSVHAVQHLECPRFKESDLHFEGHMSGFVYKVKVFGEIYIKKEIPGPDSVDEFLYEINALTALIGSKSVIQFQGLVMDEENTVVKGLLIGYAEKGALVDILYDHKGELEWARRERWAKQIIQGLSEIHEAGFVQGDFTLSNIVIDYKDEAKIIDINRRGCPVGWEPPEISRLVESSQRISMYIGVKSDLFQLGMVLWALAQEEDEPERQPRPLSLDKAGPNIPLYYRYIVSILLHREPKQRLAAKDLLLTFPELGQEDLRLENLRPISEKQAVRILSSSHKVYVDRSLPNTDGYEIREDINGHGSPLINGHTYGRRPGSVDLPIDLSSSYLVDRRGRQPPTNISHLSLSDRCHSSNRNKDSEPQIVAISPTGERRWEEVEMDGTPYLIQRDSLEFEDFKRTGRISEALRREIHSVNADIGRRFDHVDSGFADMDMTGGFRHREFQHVDSGLADMDLAGVGGHESLKLNGKVDGEGDDAADPRGKTDDTGLDLDDRHGDMDT
ncbi:MAG: hypothetical protein LQ351_003820 [Letrouitia transgressa]|nr:MAG: hypothetical protein LQ351_003820 [Letrouitia transgressa]